MTIAYDDSGIQYSGSWSDDDPFKESDSFSARLSVIIAGDEIRFMYGVGPDHSIFDVYIGGTLWRSYDLRTIAYTYDRISRLIEADYDNGAEIFAYRYDLAGNLTDLNGASRTYNAANQMTNDGTNTYTYDRNGNLWKTNDVETHTWDRANRLLSFGGIGYAYNGDGNRISQDALKYLLDLQPGLAVVLGDSDGNRYVYSPRGIHAVNDGVDWTYPLTDALGSLRGYVDATNAVLSNINYSEYGVPDTSIIGPAFTGEWRDETEVQYHRARYSIPGLGIWLSLDPFEGMMNRPMSLNGYSWVEGNVPNGAVGELIFHNRYSYANGNPVNLTDPSGNAAIDIWAAAFISPETIRFPFGVDPIAIWHGDNRSWHTTQDFNYSTPHSSRVWWGVRFDTANLSTIRLNQDTGDTFVVYAGIGINNIYVTHGKAPTPAPSSVKRINPFGDIEVTMEAGLSGKNPLSEFAPPIEIRYTMYFRSNGQIEVYADIDRFPWHELHVAVDGISSLQMQQEPLGPSYTPADLALPALNTIFRVDSASLRDNFSDSSLLGLNCLPIPYLI